MVSGCYLCKNKYLYNMEIISARHFRANQTAVLNKAKRGESVLLSSRVGMLKIVPVSDEDSLTSRICEGLREVKMMEEGKIPVRSARTFLNEL